MDIIYLNDLPVPENPSMRVTNRGLVWDQEQQLVLINKEGHTGANGAHPSWELPGGGVDDGEDIEASTLREIREETGLICKIIEKAGILHVIADEFTKKNYKPVDIIEHHVFLLKPTGGTFDDAQHDEGEVQRGLEAYWLPLNEAIEKASLTSEEDIWRLHSLWALDWLKSHLEK